MRVYICICTHANTDIHRYTYIYMYKYILHVYRYVSIYIYMYLRMCICIYTIYIHVCVFVYTCMHAHTYILTRSCFACTRICKNRYTHRHVCTPPCMRAQLSETAAWTAGPKLWHPIPARFGVPCKALQLGSMFTTTNFGGCMRSPIYICVYMYMYI